MDDDFPPITIVITTWAPEGAVGGERRKALKETLDTWRDHLRYRGQLFIHVADDGSALPGYPEDCFPEHAISFSKQHRRGVGASLNAGFEVGFQRSPLVAYFVDDWALNGPMDLTVWAQILMKEQDVGVFRLGPPHPDISGRIRVFWEPHAWAFKLDRHHYAYSMRPALYHQRFVEAYGWWRPEISAVDCETAYSENFNKTAGIPEVYYACPYPWYPVGAVKMGEVVPGAGSESQIWREP